MSYYSILFSVCLMCCCCYGVGCIGLFLLCFFFFQAEDGIRDLVRSRGLGDVYKRQVVALRAAGQRFVGRAILVIEDIPVFRAEQNRVLDAGARAD